MVCQPIVRSWTIRFEWRYVRQLSVLTQLGYASNFTCAECNERSCFNCPELFHLGFTCAEYQTFLHERSDIDAATAEWLTKNTKRCPLLCNRPIEKNKGCDHMTCILCKAEWCWLCGVDYNLVRSQGRSAHKTSCSLYMVGLPVA